MIQELRQDRTKTMGGEENPQPIRGSDGATIIGPANVAIESENLSRLRPPETDAGTVVNCKFSFSNVHNRLEPGGWSRQITIRELPIATQLAIVNMRLSAGTVREMHWHKEAEWGFLLKGRARVTSVDQDLHAYQDDVGEGEGWLFPAGVPHSIQGLDPDGCEFLLVFDDGVFNENETFLVTDWLAHTPKDAIAKNFGVPESAFANIPKGELYIFRAEVPPPLAQDRVEGTGPLPQTFTHRMTSLEPLKMKYGQVRIMDSTNFPVSTTIAAALVEVEPGGMRELHWHPNSDELQYFLSGSARMTVYAAGSNAETFDFQAGDVGYIPRAMPHYVENTGTETMRYLEMFRAPKFIDVPLAQWLKFTPHELVKAHLNIDESILEKIPGTKMPVVGD